MNYALDAIWWRLRQPHIRALASLLTAPPLWHTGCELPVRELLGEQGFRLLLAWDDDVSFAFPFERQHTRLGHYAEDLLAFWFANAPHSRLIARDVAIVENGRILGALDFVVELSGCLYHIELCSKYYGGTMEQPEKMLGLNTADSLAYKAAKLQQQLRLSGCFSARQTLVDCGVEANKMQAVSIVRGVGFTPTACLNEEAVYPVNAWNGIFIDDVTQWQQFNEDSVFYRMERMEYLAPARVSAENILTRDAVIQLQENGLYAQMVARPDGWYHEMARVMYRQKAA